MAKITGIGERRNRIRIETPTATRSAAGAEVWTWSRFTEVWAKVSYVNAKSGEDVEANHSVNSTAVTFDIAYRDDLDETMRIVFDGRNFDILYIQKPDFRRSLLIQAQNVE